MSIQQVKDFWNNQPCNIKHSCSPIGSKQYFNEVQKRRYFVEPHIPKFAQFGKWHNKQVLEIGCGIGTDTISFARRGAKVTAVELSEHSLELAKRQAEIYGVQNRIQFYLGNAEELTSFVPIQSYDLIYSFGVIHHTPSPKSIIREIYHYASSKSLVKLMLYHRYSWKVLWILFTQGKSIACYSEAQTGCPITHTYTKKTAHNLLEQNGFEIININIEHIFPYQISGYIKHKYIKVWYFRLMPKFLFNWLTHNFGWHLCITARRKHSGYFCLSSN